MTVNTTSITSGPYIGNATAAEFAYDFPVDNARQLTVFETNGTGVVSTLVLNTDYTVAGVGNDSGGMVTRSAGALPNGWRWYIRSNYLETQDTDFNSQGGFFPDVHENAFDKLTILIQQLLDRIGRTFRLSDSYSGPLPLSIDEPRAQQILRWRSDLTGIESVPLSSLDPDLIATDQIPLVFPNVASMQSFAAPMVGMILETEGWALAGDEGGNRYEVRSSGVPILGRVIALQNGLFGHAIFPGGVRKPEQYGAVGTGDVTTALLNWLQLGGRLTANGTYNHSSTLNLIRPTIIEGTGTFTWSGLNVARDQFFVSSSDVKISKGITIDGGHSDETYAGGYIVNHNGIHVRGTDAARLTGVELNCEVLNQGEACVIAEFTDGLTCNSPHWHRGGAYGFYGLSTNGTRIYEPVVDNIYPGITGSPVNAPYWNAYGITFTNFTGQPVCDDCAVFSGQVTNVTSWEAYDTHRGTNISFIDCSSEGCGQGIAIESVQGGFPSKNIKIIGGTHKGYGVGHTRSGQTYDTGGGVVANGGGPGEFGTELTIKGVTVDNMGGAQPGTSAAAFKIEQWKTFKVIGNSACNAYQWGFRCHVENQDGVMIGNSVDGVIVRNAIMSAFSFSNQTFCVVDDNTVSGLPSGGKAWDIPIPSGFNFGIKFGIGNVVEGSGIDAFADSTYQNILAGSAYLGSAKAVLQYNGATNTIVDRMGVTSVSKNAVGDYSVTFNFTGNNTLAITCGGSQPMIEKVSSSINTVQIRTRDSSGTLADDTDLSITAHAMVQRK